MTIMVSSNELLLDCRFKLRGEAAIQADRSRVTSEKKLHRLPLCVGLVDSSQNVLRVDRPFLIGGRNSDPNQHDATIAESRQISPPRLTCAGLVGGARRGRIILSSDTQSGDDPESGSQGGVGSTKGTHTVKAMAFRQGRQISTLPEPPASSKSNNAMGAMAS